MSEWANKGDRGVSGGGLTSRIVGALRARVRLRPYDVATAEGRTAERNRRAALTTLMSGVAKAASVATALVTVPLTLHYLGPERYGLWMVISSVVAMLTFADLGLGNGLLNAVAEAHGRDDRALARASVSSAVFMLAGVALILAAVFVVLYPRLPWARLFNVTSPQACAEAGPAVAVLLALFLAGLPLGTVGRIQLGYQEGYRYGLWQAAGSLGGLAAVLLVIHLRGGLPWLVGAMAGAPVAATLLNGVALFAGRRPWLTPRWSCVSAAAARRMARNGLLFFVLQIAAVLILLSDTIIIARLCGTAQVPQYAVPARLFSLAPMLVSMVLAPLWPAYGEAAAHGDVAWIRHSLKRSVLLALVGAGVPSLALVLFGKPLLVLWVGAAVAPGLALLIGLALWTAMCSVGEAVAMFLNGTNAIRVQAATAVLTCGAAIAARIALGRAFGIPGVVAGSVLAYTAFTVLPLSLYVPRVLKRL